MVNWAESYLIGRHCQHSSRWMTKIYCTRPEALKVRVRGSFSFPKAPRGRPLKLTSIPPAFPVLRTSVLPALMFLCLSAGKTRCITDFPSATIETQESSLAFTCTKNALALPEATASTDSVGTASRLGSAGRELAADCA